MMIDREIIIKTRVTARVYTHENQAISQTTPFVTHIRLSAHMFTMTSYLAGNRSHASQFHRK